MDGPFRPNPLKEGEMNNIQLYVKPQVPPMMWGKFKQYSPPFSIALDGFVATGPRRDMKGPRLNYNHHEEVDRLCTRATCGQVLMAIRQGLFQRFRRDGQPTAFVYVNDCDEDVCLSWFLLRNFFRFEGTMDPLLNRLVYMEDALDATAGAYPFPKDLPLLQELAWVFAPYRNFRLSGGVDRKDAIEFQAIIEQVCDNIDKHLMGKGGNQSLDLRYEVVAQGSFWAMVHETGAQARTAMYADGLKAFTSVRERPDGRYTYTIGRMSPFIPFNVPSILQKLNAADPEIGPDTEDMWGGGDTIGGSPRVNGTSLEPKEVLDIISSEIERAREAVPA